MKTMKWILLAAVVLAAVVACGQKKEAKPKVLVLYYSQTSMTKAVAECLAEKLGADLEEIVPVEPYSGSFEETIARGREELDNARFPALQPLNSDIASYDVIFLGYPIWFGTYANPIASLIETVDLKGKQIVPFCTFGSGGLESSTTELALKLPDSEILPPYGVRAARIDAAPAEIERFLKVHGYLPGEVVKLDDFSEEHPVSEEEAATFDAAVGDYPMIHAKATQVSSRPLPIGMEYLFKAVDVPREGQPAFEPREMEVYVLVEEGKDPVFTRVVR